MKFLQHITVIIPFFCSYIGLAAKEAPKGNLAQYTQSVSKDYAELVNSGMDLLKTYKTDSAIIKFKKAVKLEPKNALTYVYLGLAFSDKKLFQESIDQFEEAIKLGLKDELLYLFYGKL